MKDIVLIHGAGVGGWVYRDVEKVLKCYDWNVYSPSLSGIGDVKKDKDYSLKSYAKEIIDLIETENLKDVYLVGHSFGGVIVSTVVEMIPERIKMQIYIDSFFLENNESILHLFGEEREKRLINIAKEEGEGYYLPKRLFGKPHPLIKDMPFDPYVDIAQYEGVGAKVSGVYIDCLNSDGFEHLVKPKKVMKERTLKRGWKYIKLDSGHTPMTRSPWRERLIDILIEIIKK